jgi:cysteine synthase A
MKKTCTIFKETDMEKIARCITELIGKTPMLELSRINTYAQENQNRIIAKLEFFNPLSSIKDRIGLSMIEGAEKSGRLKPGNTIVEPTSGNTGIALAYVSTVKGYKLILTMPDTMSVERRQLLNALGAEIVLTPGEKGMQGAVDRAYELTEQNSGYVILQQFKNPDNPGIHRETTANEIWDDTDGKTDILVAGVGTGGTITGVGEVLKERNPGIRIIAVEPADSAVLSGEKPGPHKLQGIGAGFVPEILNTKIIDRVIKVKNEDAIYTAKELAKKEGILAGISSGAALWAALEVASEKENKNRTIVVILPDTGERYLSIDLFT